MKVIHCDITPANVAYEHREISSQVERDGVTSGVIRLETDNGLVGWGESCSGADMESVLASVRAMAPFVLGDDVFTKYPNVKRLLDEVAGLVEWLKMGGALLPDLRLEAELVSVRWKDVEGGKSALEHKSAIKERLGRSPDRADSLALATYTPSGWYRPATLDAPERAPGPERGERDAFDPYRARIAETFDPFSTGSYGGEGRRR